MTNFDSFELPSFLRASLEKMRISVPTPIQTKAIPAGMEGHDILASAQTGTGKTMAYLIPLITNLLKTSRSSALVLAPTRDLAMQIQDTARALLGKELDIALLIGGAPMFKQLSALKRHPRLIIGTPGRIKDHLDRKSLRLQDTSFLVLDEADRMLDMGFSKTLNEIVKHLPKERQTFMFSATLPPSITTLSMTYLTNPQRISVGSTTEPTLKIKQETLETSTAGKFPNLLNELNNREGSIIVFVKTKHGADRLAKKLTKENHHAVAVHGDLRQNKREKVIRDFRNLKMRIMVATDLAARGLDIPHIKHVINYDLPQCPEDYIHRIGRTGRADSEGSSISLISPDENIKWKRIHRLIHTGKSDPEPMRTGNNKKRRTPSNSKRKDFGKERRNENTNEKNFSKGAGKSFNKGSRNDNDNKKSFSKGPGKGFGKSSRSENDNEKSFGKGPGKSFSKGSRNENSFGEKSGKSFAKGPKKNNAKGNNKSFGKSFGKGSRKHSSKPESRQAF